MVVVFMMLLLIRVMLSMWVVWMLWGGLVDCEVVMKY